MSAELTEQIIRHVYYCLGVKLPGKDSLVYSISQPEYLIPQKITYDDGQTGDVWGIKFDIADNELSILLADCTQDNVPEFALLVNLKDTPAYGAYLIYKEYSAEEMDSAPLIACSVMPESWTECSTYLQATFLMGMEKIREINAPINALSDSEEMYKNLLSFIRFYQERFDER